MQNQILQLVRILNQKGNHSFLLGDIGVGKETITQISCFIMDIHYFNVGGDFEVI